jgi:hypothetical protein
MDIANNLIDDEEFRAKYKESANSPENATKLWNTYNRLCNVDPREMIKNGQYSQLRDWFFKLLNVCKQIDGEAFKIIHKGHPYYFIGITSYYLHDYRTSIYFFDAAVQEDLNAGAEPKTNPKPSTRFLMLEGEADRQAAKEITEYAQTKVQRALDFYNDVTGKVKVTKLTLENLRDKFIYKTLTNGIQPGLRTLVTSLIIFCVEWDYRNEHLEFEIAEKTSSQPFFLHIFEGCLLFESLLRNKPNPKPDAKTLDYLLRDEDIKTKFGKDFSIIKRQLNKPNQRDYSIEDLHEYIQGYDNTIEKTLHITYVARNVLGHNIGWDKSIKQDEYRKLCFIILSSCFYAIDCLWNI